MTSNKDLEKRMIKRLNDRCPPDWWHIICMTGAILGVVALILFVFGPSQYTPASPNFFCELGLMEWEYEDTPMIKIRKVEIIGKNMHYCNDTEYGFICKGMNETRIYTDKTKSCPYSGPDLMVMQND